MIVSIQAYKLITVLILVCTLVTLYAATTPQWFLSPDSHYGLTQHCTSSTCHPFPSADDCTNIPCAGWRSAVFAVWCSLMLQCCSLFALIAGNSRRGWRIVSVLVSVAAVMQAGGSLSLYVVAADSLFHGQWRVGGCWIVVTASWVVMAVVGIGLGIVHYMDEDEEEDEEYFGSDDESVSNYGSITTSERDFRTFNKQARKKFLQSVGMG